MLLPKESEPVLAKIQYQNCLGTSQWYEVVYYDTITEQWKGYQGGTSFEDGEKVLAWYYCKYVFNE